MQQPYINPFISDYLPDVFWPPMLAVFGRTVEYLPQGDASQSVMVKIIWKEGASDEDVSPGRYSHINLRNADLPVTPALGDVVRKDDKEFDVVRINALAVYFSVIVLQDSGPVL